MAPNRIHPMTKWANTETWLDNIQTIGKRSISIMQSMAKGDANSPLHGLKFVLALGFSYKELLWQCFYQLGQDAQGKAAIRAFHQDIKRLTKFTKAAMLGRQAQSMFAIAKEDKRFKNPAWRESWWHRCTLQAYLMLSHHLQHFTEIIPLTGRDKQQINFCVDLLLETLCPNNSLLTNPEALRYTRQEKGLNLLKGMNYFLEDFERWQGHINLSKTNFNAFTVGKNLATSPGKVIYRNEVIELIFYQSSTLKQYTTPILLITSWINKFYILDLREKNSLVRWLNQQGFAVFCISWINPDASHQDLGLETFVHLGIVQAISTIKNTLGCEQVHALGYCLGGTLLAISASLMQKQRLHGLASLTFVATLVDFAEGGGIGNLMGPKQLAVYEKTLAQDHLWDGHKMQIGFNLTNSNHFIWPFMQRRYLLGKPPIAVDSIHWGLDLANTSEAMYRFYTNDLHRDNTLMTAGALKVGGVAIDISQIKVPVCCVGFEEDTISPWQTAYGLAQMHKGQFILGNGTHITGLVTPASLPKAKHWAGQAKQHQAKTWLDSQTKTSGSWWQPWQQWLSHKEHHQEHYLINYHGCKTLASAPGDYVISP